MRPLLVIAAGGLARETVEAVREDCLYDPIGLLDDASGQHGTTELGLPVLGGLDEVARHPDAAVLICTGRGATREAIVLRLGLPDDRYASVVHPSVSVPDSCAVGVGCIALAGSVLTASVTLGRHVVLMPHVVLTHDNTVADYATLCAGVVLGGMCPSDRAYIGMRACVRERVHIGPDSTIGMGAVVLRDVPARQTWVGSPAQPLLSTHGVVA